MAEVYYWPEVASTRVNAFWDADGSVQEKVIEVLARSGARIVVSRQEPRGAGVAAWHQIGNTAYYLRWLAGGDAPQPHS